MIRQRLALAGSYPYCVWTCAWCAAVLSDECITHRDDCRFLAEVAAHAAAAERAAIQAHLRDVVTDHVPQGNDYVLGALLDAIRELVPLCGAESPGDASGDTKPPDMPQPRPQAAHRPN
jgi:hypothetical protein